MPAVEMPWSNLHPGLRVRWMTPRFLKYGEIVAVKGKSMRVLFDGDRKPTNIPDARWYFVQHKATDRENGLVVWSGGATTRGHLNLSPEFVEDDMLSSAQAAELFSISGKELRRWLRSGKVAGQQVRGVWLVDATSLGRFLADR